MREAGHDEMDDVCGLSWRWAGKMGAWWLEFEVCSLSDT